jgi:hypothetical protein
MKDRLREARQSSEELVALLLALAESLQTDAATHAKIEQIVARAVTLRSDLRRLEKFADALGS